VRFIGLAEIHLAQWTFKEFVIQKNQRIQGDTLGIGSDMAISSRMFKELNDVIRHHLLRVFQAMKTNKTPDPLNAGLFGSETVSIQPHKPGNLIQKRAFAYGSYPPEITVWISSISAVK
jgi:hypothetical protein